MSRYVSASLLADNAEFDRAWERSAVVSETTADKIAKSAQMAARSAAAQAKAAGASASEQQAAAARAAVSYTEAADKISKAQQAAGKAAMDAAKTAGASADEQVAAWKKAVAATGEYEAAQKRAADSAKASAATQAKAAEESAARVSAAHKKITSLGKWTIAGGLGAGFFSVKGASELQAQMERLHTQAGASQKAVQQLTGSVLNMAGPLGTGPDQLAQAMYHVTSAFQKAGLSSLDNAAKLQVLRTASEGAKTGGADLVDVTNALDAAVVSGVRGVQDYKQAMGALNATVGAGDMTMQNLADALSTGLLGPMKNYGLSIKDVGGALAVFGDNNIRGQEAATKLTSAVRIMAAPSKEAAKALGVVGISATQLADDMRRGGIVQAIADLKKHLEESGLTASQQALVITRAFGGRQSTGVQLLIGQLDRLRAKTQEVGTGAGTFNADWIATTHTLKFQLDQVGASVQAEADKIGMWLLPKVHDLIVVTEDVTNWLGKHKAAAEALAFVIGGALTTAVAVFAYDKAVAFANGVKGMVTGIGQLTGAITPVPTETEALTKAVQGLTTALTPVAGEAEGAATGIESLGAAAAGATPEVEGLDTALGAGGLLGTVGSLVAKMGPLAAAFGAFEALKQTPGIGDVFGNGPGPSNAYPAPKRGETERSYIAQMNGLSPGPYKGPLTVAGVLNARANQGLPAEKGLVEQLFKQIGEQGHFGRHGFVPAPQSPGTPTSTGMVLSKSWLNAGKSIGGFSSGEQTNAAAIMAALTRGGLSTAGAAALTGNWVQESGLDPSRSGGLLAQWGGSRLTNEQAYAKSRGMAYNSIPAETGFALHELQSTPGLLAMLKAGNLSPQQLALAVENKYEEPKGTAPGAGYFSPDSYWSANTAGRESYAAQIYSAFSGKQTSGDMVGITNTPSASTLAAYNALVGGSTNSTSKAGKATMRYYQHQPVGMMTEAEWQAWQAQNSGKVKQAAALKRAGSVADSIFAATDRLHTQYATTGASLTQRYGNAAQSGTTRTLENALGVSTSGMAPLTRAEMGNYRENDQALPTVVQYLRAQIEAMGRNPSMAQIGRRVGGTLTSAAAGSPQEAKFNAAVENLIQTGQTKQADKLVAAHKAAMQALAATMYADQKTRDGQMLEQQATALKDQTTAIQNAMQDAQNVFQAQEQKANDAASATVQAMQDMQQIVNDQMAAMVQATRDATQLSSDQSQGIVQAINDQTQTQVDQIGEKGLYGLNLVAQKLQVQADITKAGFDQQITQATQAFDVLQMQADQQEAMAQLNLDQVTEQQHAAVAAAQQRLDIVTLREDTAIAAAQAHADAVQLHVDSSLIGPAQIALDLNANASKSVQAKFQAQLTAATGLGDKQVQGAQQALQKVQSAAQSAIDAAQATYDAANNSAQQMIQGAQDNLSNLTNNFNNLLATAQQNLQSLENTAAQTEATQQGQVATTQATAGTQFAGTGLTVQVFGVPMDNAAAMASETSWAIRSAGLAA